MALVLADRVLETTTTTGSGTITLAGAKPGYQSFSSIGDGNTTYYTIALQGGVEWEVGIGTYTASGTTLSRDTVLASSDNGAKVTFSFGTKDVFVDYPAEKAIFPGTSGNISALSGKIINLAAPEDNSDAATKQYVDDLVSTGLYYHDPVQLTTTSAFTGYSITYNNGTAGVSATITQASSYSSLTIDSTAAAVGNRILVKDATNAAYNGVYVVNDTGSGSTPWVMMRSADTDSYGASAGNLSQNDYFYTQNGVANKGAAYVCNTEGTIVFGTTAINFALFSNAQVYTAGTGIDITGTTVSLQTPVSVPNGGTGAATLTGYVKGNGTSALSTVSTIPAADISDTLSISQGGTSSSTQQGAINALAGAVTSGYYLRGNGTNVGMSAIQAGDVPTLNQNTTGQAGSVANALTINNSGAGDASGSTYNGSAAKTISYNSIGASPLAGSTSLTTVGTITIGTWNAGDVTATGGTITAANMGTQATTQFQGASANITTFTASSANIATLSGTTATFTSASVTNLNLTSITLSNLSVSSANITTLTGTTFGDTLTTQLRGASGNITTLTGTSANITTITGSSANITTINGTSADITTITGTTIGTTLTTQFKGASASITTITGTTSKFTNTGDQTTTQFQGASANITTITGSSANITTINGTSADITTITGTTIGTTATTQLKGASATITNLSGTSAQITTITGTTIGTTATTQLQGASATITNLSGTSAQITTITGTNIGTTATTQLQGASANITTLTTTSGTITTFGSTSANITTLNTTSGTVATLGSTSANITTLTGTSATITTILDGAGLIRNIPQVTKTAAYTLATTDIGKYISTQSGTVTVPNNTFAAGNAVSVYNDSANTISLTLSTTTAYVGGTNTNRTGLALATRGVCTVLFVNPSYCVITGNVT